MRAAVRAEFGSKPSFGAPAPSKVLPPTTFSQHWGAAIADSQLPKLAASRCTLGVLHPHGALLPPPPAEPISSRFRSWGSPFEALIRHWRRATSQPPAPPGFPIPITQKAQREPPFRGFAHQQQPMRGSWVLARVPAPMPPWAFPSEASCPSSCGWMPIIPSRALGEVAAS
jgi:hypothetical protein